ncbi:MAG: PDZ domain-containing protein [Planctomycetota bacterium]
MHAIKASNSLFLLFALTFWISLPLANPLKAQSQIELLEKEQAAFRQAAAVANPYVVQIETFGGMERIGEKFVADGPTTGTILTEEGWIVSSLFSFRQRPASILVALPDGSRESAELVARDFSRQLALLKVKPKKPLPHIPQSDVEAARLTPESVGTWVVALGKTYDKKTASQSSGIVSAIGRAYGKAFQTDAKISPINYGGPVVNLEGQTLGILSPLSPGTFLEGDSSNIYDSGIGFAIPIADIMQRLPTMQKGEDIYEGKLGAVTKDQNEMAGPVRIVGAIPGSPAGKAGLQAGDIILRANDQTIGLLADLKHAIAKVDAGETLNLEVFRDGERVSGLQCELSKEVPIYQRRYLGLRFSQLANPEESNEKDAEQDNKSAEAKPVDSQATIMGIQADSPAANSDLKVGDTITAYNEQVIKSTAQLREQLAVSELDVALKLQVLRSGVELTVEVTPDVWPDTLPAALPDPEIELPENAQCKVVDIALGDFTNKAFAIVPPSSTKRTLGLLIVYPEPGEMEREPAKEHWTTFAAEQGWIVAVVNSADPKRWSPNEIELAERILGRLQKSYQLDPSRIVVGGLGIGGRLAFVAGNMLKDRIQGVLMVGTQLRGFRPPPKNFPLRSLDYLLVGEQKSLEAPKDALVELGYSVSTVDAELTPPKWETHPQSDIERWLEGLARL